MSSCATRRRCGLLWKLCYVITLLRGKPTSAALSRRLRLPSKKYRVVCQCLMGTSPKRSYRPKSGAKSSRKHMENTKALWRGRVSTVLLRGRKRCTPRDNTTRTTAHTRSSQSRCPMWNTPARATQVGPSKRHHLSVPRTAYSAVCTTRLMNDTHLQGTRCSLLSQALPSLRTFLVEVRPSMGPTRGLSAWTLLSRQHSSRTTHFRVAHGACGSSPKVNSAARMWRSDLSLATFELVQSKWVHSRVCRWTVSHSTARKPKPIKQSVP